MENFSDDRLLAELQKMVDGSVTDTSLELARAAYDWRTMDDELAELVADSLLETSGVRAHAGPRMVTFQGASVAILLEIEGLLVTGQLAPPQPLPVAVARPDGSTRTVQADEGGRFTVELAAGGPVLLRAGNLQTDWLVI
jgi:hypothetical protein